MKDLAAKILSPTRPLRVKGRVYWVKQQIPYDLQLEAGLVYDTIVDEFRFFGMLRRSEINAIINAPFSELDKSLSDFKLQLYQKYPDEFLQKPARSGIKSTIRQLNEWYSQYSFLDGATLESYAEKISSIFIIRKLGKYSYRISEKLYYEQIKKAVPLSDIRKLARSDYWQNLYNACRPFKSPLTDEQIALSSFTRMYANIQKHPECPPTEIIDDDDMLDGWLINQSKQNKKKAPSFGKKIDSSKEIFIMASNQDHANKIYDMNTEEARAIQNVRLKQIKKQGAVPFGKLADVQREIYARQP